MNPTSSLRALVLGSSALLAVSALPAANLYWDGGSADIGTNGNGVSAGTAGTWNTTLLNWDAGTSAHVAWNNSNFDTPVFGGTAGTVTLGGAVTTGGLFFFSNSGYTITAGASGLTFGASDNTISLIAQFGTTSSATLSGTVGGTGNVILSSISPTLASTLTFNGTSTGGWSGTTTLRAGTTMAFSASNQGLLNTTGISLNSGNITLTNTTGSAVENDRVSTAAITANGGTVALANTSGAGVYVESIGSVALTSGQTNFLFNTNAAGAGSQTLILSGLTRPGATSAVTFSSNSNLNTTKNMMVVTGATATASGQIIGPWATTGNTTQQTDFAVFNATAQVVGAGISASAENTWINATDTYTADDGLGGLTLTETRNITALRSISTSAAVTADFATDVISLPNHTLVEGDAIVFNTGTLPTGLALNTPYFVRDVLLASFKLAATSGGAAIDFTVSNGTGITAVGALLTSTGSNLGTTGILNASGNTMYLTATGTGAVTLPSATSDNLHLIAGAAPIIVSAPIADNGAGVLTLVKNGVNALTLSGVNTYTGGTVVNAGQLNWTNANQLGASTFRNLTVNGTATLNGNDGTSLNALSVGSGGLANFPTSTYTFTSTTGSGVVSYRPSVKDKTLNLGNASGFTGTVQALMGGTTNAAPAVQFSSLGDSVGSALQFGGGSTDGGQTANFTLNGAAPLVFNNRQVQILSRTSNSTQHGVLQNNLINNSASAANTWVINTNLAVLTGQTGRNLNLRGTNTGANAFNGVISDGNLGGTVNVSKQDAGSWTLGASNTHTGSTNISGGHLVLNHLNAIAKSSSVSVAAATSLQLNLAGTYTTAGTFTLVGTGRSGLPNTGALYFGSGGATATTLNAPLTLGGATTISSFGVTMDTTLGGAMGGTGPLTIASQGGAIGHFATWTLNAASNYSGNTIITNTGGANDGTVKLGIANAFPTTTSLNLLASNSLDVATFTTLDLNGFNQTLAGLTDTGGTKSAGSNAGKRVINSSGTLATLTINNAGNITYGTTGTNITAGTIGGLTAGEAAANHVALTKTGAGTLNLGGANTYTGDTTISAGRITVTTAANLSSGATNVVQSGTGQLFANGADTFTNPFNISGTGFAEGSDSQNNLSGGIRLNGSTLSGTVTLSGNSRISAFLGAPGTSVNTISGQITGTFGLDLYGFQNAASTSEVFVLSNPANNYTGTTTIYNSNFNTTNLAGVSTTLRLGASNVIPDGANAGNVAFAINGTNDNATNILDLNGFNETINGLTVNSGTFATQITNTAAAADSVLSIGAHNTTSSFSGTITDSGVNRTLAITKTGSGILTLSGTNSYLGGTTVNAGTLVAGAALAFGSGPVAVNAGGTLDLGGQTLANNVALAAGSTLIGIGSLTATAGTVAGTVSPGNSAGTITFTNSSVALSGTINLEIGGTAPASYDVVAANGPVTLSGIVNVALINGFTPAAGNSWDLFADDGGLTSTAVLNLPTLPGGLTWNTATFATTGVVSIDSSGDPVAAYTAAAGLTGNNALPGADPDGDGISNAIEYALGISPITNNGPEYRGIASTSPAGALNLAYRRPVGGGVAGVSYGVEFKTADLNEADTGWTAGVLETDYTQIVTPNGDGTTETVTITLVGPVSGRKFARLLVAY